MLKGHRKPLDDLIARCSRCGLCRAVCPVFLQVNQEPAAARGKLQLIGALLEEQLDGSENLAHLLSRCLVCGLCEQICPADVAITEAILRTRAGMVRSLALAEEDITFTHPSIARWSRFLRAARSSPGFPLPVILNLLGEMGEGLAPVPEMMSGPSTDPFVKSRGNSRTVGYFPGCADHLHPRICRAVGRIFTRLGTDVIMPEGTVCCGVPFMEAGDFRMARELAIENIKAFERVDVDAIVVGCSAGAWALKRQYLELLGLTGFPVPVYDLGELMMEVLPAANIFFPVPLKACYLPSRVSQHHRAGGWGLLAQIPDMELISLEEKYRCEMSVFFAVVHPEMSQKILQRTAESALSTGCQVVVTENAIFLMLLERQLRRLKSSVRVRHLAEILDLALGDGDRSVGEKMDRMGEDKIS